MERNDSPAASVTTPCAHLHEVEADGEEGDVDVLAVEDVARGSAAHDREHKDHDYRVRRRGAECADAACGVEARRAGRAAVQRRLGHVAGRADVVAEARRRGDACNHAHTVTRVEAAGRARRGHRAVQVEEAGQGLGVRVASVHTRLGGVKAVASSADDAADCRAGAARLVRSAVEADLAGRLDGVGRGRPLSRRVERHRVEANSEARRHGGLVRELPRR